MLIYHYFYSVSLKYRDKIKSVAGSTVSVLGHSFDNLFTIILLFSIFTLIFSHPYNTLCYFTVTCFVKIVHNTPGILYHIVTISRYFIIICNVVDLNSLVIFHHIITSRYFVIICHIVVALNTLIIFHHIGTLLLITLSLFILLLGLLKPWS